jgi:hypothetical protein
VPGAWKTWRTIQGYEVLLHDSERPSEVVAESDILGQIQFIREILGLKLNS